MNSLWDSLKQTAAAAGSAAVTAGQKTKLKADLLLLDRELRARKAAFGVELYQYIAPLVQGQASFFASDDLLTATLRPPLLTAQREIAALALKKTRCKEDIAQAAVTRQAAFPATRQAATFQEKVRNAGKSAGLAGHETKLATELSVIETQILYHQQEFGLRLFGVLVDLEDAQGWLPTDRNIRSMYDLARKDVEAIQERRATKEQEMRALGGEHTVSATAKTTLVADSSLPRPSIETPSSSSSSFATDNVLGGMGMGDSYGATATTSSYSDSFTPPPPIMGQSNAAAAATVQPATSTSVNNYSYGDAYAVPVAAASPAMGMFAYESSAAPPPPPPNLGMFAYETPAASATAPAPRPRPPYQNQTSSGGDDDMLLIDL